MKAAMSLALAVLLSGVISQEGWALGADHPPEQLAQQGPHCIHGYFINWSDEYFFAGDAAAFNQFVADMAKGHPGKVLVVTHPGVGRARSPWDASDRNLPADWSRTTGPMAALDLGPEKADVVRIDVWLSGQIRVDDVQYPAEVEVTTAESLDKVRALLRQRHEPCELEGTWIEVVPEGKAVGKLVRREPATLVIAGDLFELKQGNRVFRRSLIRLVPEERREAIDLITAVDGEFWLTRAIYRLEGETLVICEAGRDKDRPTDYNSWQSITDELTLLQTFKRLRPDQAEPPADSSASAEAEATNRAE